MRRKNLFLLPVFSTWLACGGGSGAGPQVAPDADFVVPFALEIQGVDASTCQVLGQDSEVRSDLTGLNLAEHIPPSGSSLEYVLGFEEALLLSCTTGKALFAPGAPTVAVDSLSTTIAERLSSFPLERRTLVLAKVLRSFEKRYGVLTSVDSLTSGTTELLAAKAVLDGLIGFEKAYEALRQATSDDAQKVALVSMLVQMGFPVVVENLGALGLVGTCTPSDPALLGLFEAGTASQVAAAVDASVVGMTGCLVYHGLDAIWDRNNPAGTPANSAPDSFRNAARETGVVEALLEAHNADRCYSISDVHELIFNEIGHTGFSQDDEGAVSGAVVSVGDLQSFAADFRELDQVSWGADERFHTGYNPSGGRTFDVAVPADVWQTHPWSSACYDSTGDALDQCPVAGLRFQFDGANLTEDLSGPYVLRLEFVEFDAEQKPVYKDLGWVHESDTGRPYRDPYYRPVSVVIDASAYAAIYYANPLSDKDLDPLSDGNGNSVPWSNQTWRDANPGMNLVDNAYLYPTPEVVQKLAILIDDAWDNERLTALQALGYSQLMTRGLAAIPTVQGVHAILNTHELSLSEWDSKTAAWLSGGVPAPRLVAKVNLELAKGVYRIAQVPKCEGGGIDLVNTDCVFGGSLSVDLSSVNSGGDATTYALSGSLSFTHPTMGTSSFAPTTLWISKDEKTAELRGDVDLVAQWKTNNLITALNKGQKRIDPTTLYLIVGTKP